MNLNKVILCGRVTKLPEVKMTTSGKKVAKISLATNMYQGKGKEDKTTFHNLVAWERTAEIVESFVVVGHEILVEGSIDNRSYEKDGVKKYTTEIIVERLQLGSKPKSDKQSNYQPEQPETVKRTIKSDLDEKDIPIIEDGDEINIEDIPF